MFSRSPCVNGHGSSQPLPGNVAVGVLLLVCLDHGHHARQGVVVGAGAGAQIGQSPVHLLHALQDERVILGERRVGDSFFWHRLTPHGPPPVHVESTRTSARIPKNENISILGSRIHAHKRPNVLWALVVL